MDNIHYGRKRKGIQQQLNTVIGQWLKSITCKKVRDIAGKNVIVTGGSIASMLLGEKVNDYDVYFRTEEANYTVSKYYVDKFLADNAAPSDMIKVFVIDDNSVGSQKTRVMVGVGDNPREEIKLDRKDAKKRNKDRYRPIFISSNAITLSNKFQIVTRFHGSPKKLHENYDFIHAMNYYDFKKQKLKLKPEALENILSRSLVYRGSLYPVASIFRMKKFIKRGWRITAGEMFKIMFQISLLDLTNIEVLKEQLTGVDALYLRELMNALESHEGEIDSTVVMKYVDKIFG